MWTVNAPAQTVNLPHEDDARRYVARAFPNADRIGIYTWRSHGVDITISHKWEGLRQCNG